MADPKTDTIRSDSKGGVIRTRIIGASIAGLAACVLAISAAVFGLGPGNPISGNIIAAGHLVLEINEGNGSQIAFDNLVPGDKVRADQLLTADLLGVPSAQLTLHITGSVPSELQGVSELRISSSPPASLPTLNWNSATQTCTPAPNFGSPVTVDLVATDQVIPLGSFAAADTALCVRFEFAMHESASDPAQDKAWNLGLNYTLTQTAAETP